jgi:hypothetical protein
VSHVASAGDWRRTSAAQVSIRSSDCASVRSADGTGFFAKN